MCIPPLAIQMAIHYYTTPTPYAADNPYHANSPAAQDWHQELVNFGLLRPVDLTRYGAKYEATEACRVYVEALCAVPFPVQKWVIPEP